MHYIFIGLACLFSQQLFSQCNTTSIFANDSTNAVCFDVNSNVRECHSNNIPAHSYGPFGGGNTIAGQDFSYYMCRYPELGTTTTELIADPNFPGCGNGIIFGVSHQGVNYSPFARLYWENPNTMQENTNYVIEAEFILSMDANGGHVNNISRYHYHNISVDHFANDLNIDGTLHSPIVGYAADGFPIYYKYLYTNPMDSTSGITAFASSYALKTGNRPGNGITAPDGPYDGNYVQDYEYIANLSELDDCGGRFGVTPDYPNGTYYYVLTDNWPWIPRCLKGRFVDNSFRLGPNCPSSTAATDCSPLATQTMRIQDELSIDLYPNPSSDFVKIVLGKAVQKEDIIAVRMYNLEAKTVYESNQYQDLIDVSKLEAGIYFVQIDLEQEQITQKIIIQ